jgi:SAM-dependent methyltransferase
LFRNPVASADELAELYAASWSAPATARAETGGTTDRLARLYVARLLRTLGLARLDGLRILDFGAGRGEMLAALRDRGADVCGLERFGYDFLRERGFAVYRSLADVPPGLRFDGAVSVDVVEHLAWPWDDLAALGASLQPGAFLYVATMNARGLNAMLSGPRWRELLKAGHLVFFTAATLRAALRAAGFGAARRLRWRIPYPAGALRGALYWVLQALGLDGELRFVARRNAPSRPRARKRVSTGPLVDRPQEPH